MYQVNTIVEKLGESATYQQLVMKFGQSSAGKNCPSCKSTVVLSVIIWLVVSKLVEDSMLQMLVYLFKWWGTHSLCSMRLQITWKLGSGLDLFVGCNSILHIMDNKLFVLISIIHTMFTLC